MSIYSLLNHDQDEQPEVPQASGEYSAREATSVSLGYVEAPDASSLLWEDMWEDQQASGTSASASASTIASPTSHPGGRKKSQKSKGKERANRPPTFVPTSATTSVNPIVPTGFTAAPIAFAPTVAPTSPPTTGQAVGRSRRRAGDGSYVVKWTSEGLFRNQVTNSVVPIPPPPNYKEGELGLSIDQELEWNSLVDTLTSNLMKGGLQCQVYDETLPEETKQRLWKASISLAVDRVLRGIEQSFAGSRVSWNNYPVANTYREVSRLVREDATEGRYLLGQWVLGPRLSN